MNNIHKPMGLFDPQNSAAPETDLEQPDLAQRLRADHSGQLRRDVLQQLDDMQANLRTLASRGADNDTWTKIEAGLGAVAAARDIMTRMPVSATLTHPAGALPADPFRSTP